MKLVEHKTFSDNRGSYTPIGMDTMAQSWDQCSISINEHAYTFRGMHFQQAPAQEKYIKVVRGRIIDFGYDLATGKTFYMELDANSAVYLHDGYAHGFLTLEPDTIVAYLVKGEYNPASERSLVWSDIPEVREVVLQYTDQPILSEKDAIGK